MKVLEYIFIPQPAALQWWRKVHHTGFPQLLEKSWNFMIYWKAWKNHGTFWWMIFFLDNFVVWTLKQCYGWFYILSILCHIFQTKFCIPIISLFLRNILLTFSKMEPRIWKRTFCCPPKTYISVANFCAPLPLPLLDFKFISALPISPHAPLPSYLTNAP